MTSAVNTRETPLRISGLKAFWDARSDAYFTFGTGSAIASWASRAGSLGAISFTQGTAANQPARVTGVANFNGRNVVRFDGVNDFMTIDNQNACKFLHDGSGRTVWRVRRVDSTGGATQMLLLSASTASEIGVIHFYSSTPSVTSNICNGSGTLLSNFIPTGSGTRDSTAWECHSHITGTATYARSGSVQTLADTGSPSSSNPTRALILGSSTGAALPFKGDLAAELWFDHVLTAGERSTLAAWSASEFGAAA